MNYLPYCNVVCNENCIDTIVTPVYVDTTKEKLSNDYDYPDANDNHKNNTIPMSWDNLSTFCDEQRQMYRAEKQNTFSNFKNLTEEVDRTIDMADILDRDLWNEILSSYFNKYFIAGDKKSFTLYMFLYILGFMNSEGVLNRENPFNVESINDLFLNLSPVRIVELLIEHAIMQGHQIFGVISDLMDIAINLQPGSDECDDEMSMDVVSDVEDFSYSSVDNSVAKMTASKLAFKKQKIRWRNVCASLILYFTEIVPISGKRSSNKRLCRKSAFVLRLLYIYNHSNSMVVENILSEFKYKHAMISNIINVAASKFQNIIYESSNVSYRNNCRVTTDSDNVESMYAPYDMITALSRRIKFSRCTLDIVQYLATFYWKPVRITDDIYIYTGKRYKMITLSSFAQYFGTTMKSSVASDLESRIVQYTCSHPRQFLYPTNVSGSGVYGNLVYYSYNSVYGNLENTDGCNVTLLYRKYPDPEICNLGRFNSDVYDITVDCINALSDYKLEIEMSIIRLLFCRPIVPFCLDTLPANDLELIFQHNCFALSMSDYREAFETVDQNTERLHKLIGQYVTCDISLISTFSIAKKIFYFTFMWFMGVMVYILNCDIYGCDSLDIDTLVSDLFGNDALSQIGLSQSDETHYEERTSDSRGFPLSTYLIKGDNSNETLNILNYENYKDAKDFMLRLHHINISFPEYGELHETNYSTANVFPAIVREFTEKIEKNKLIGVNRYKEDKRRLHSVLRRNLDRENNGILYRIVTDAITGSKITMDDECYRTYIRNVNSLSSHNLLVVLILTIHSMKRVYSKGFPPTYILHHALIDTYVKNREDILTWFVDKSSYHNELWKFDFFTKETTTNNLLLDYIMSVQETNKYVFIKTNFIRFCPIIELISNSLHYIFTLVGNDLEKMDFLLRKTLGFSFPGQWEGKITMIDGESRSGKTLLCGIWLTLYAMSNPIFQGNKHQANSPHLRFLFESFIGCLEDVKKIDGEILKYLVTEMEFSYRQNGKNMFTSAYPLCHIIASGNFASITDPDTATKNRVSVCSINVKNTKMETPTKGNFAYLSASEIKLMWNYIPDTIRNELPTKMNPNSVQNIALLDEEVVMPYMITQFIERNRPVQTMMNKMDIAKGLQYVTDYFSRYCYFKSDISDPSGLYNKSLSAVMSEDSKKWLERFSPYDRWLSMVKCVPLGSGERHTNKIPFDYIERNMIAFLSKYYRHQTVAITDLVLAFQRDFEKRYGYHNHNTGNMEYAVKFDKIEFDKIFK